QLAQVCVTTVGGFVASPLRWRAAMSKLEQLASAHESVSEILHAMDAFVLIGIICVAAGIPMPAEILEVRYRNPRIEIRGLVKRAQGKIVDLVYSTLSSDGKLELWLVEVEL